MGVDKRQGREGVEGRRRLTGGGRKRDEMRERGAPGRVDVTQNHHFLSVDEERTIIDR